MIISIFNESASVTDQDLLNVIDAVNWQLAHHFSSHWPQTAKLQPVASGGNVPSPDQLTNAALFVYDTPQGLQPGVHRANNGGPPYAYVFTELAVNLGIAWSVPFSHEILEMLVDPQLNQLVVGPAPNDASQNVKYLKEVCDPVQGNTYNINGVAVSNFVTPTYFSAGATSSTDYLGTGIAAFGVNPGGYVQYEDPTTGGIASWGDGAGMRVMRAKDKYLGVLRRVRRHAVGLAKPKQPTRRRGK